MEPLHPIFWGQGMFLQPQHFQQQDRYHEARVRRSLHWLAPLRGASNSWCSMMPRCRTVCMTLTGTEHSCVSRGRPGKESTQSPE